MWAVVLLASLWALGAAGDAVAASPTASFTMSRTVTPVGEPVTFTDTSTDPDGDLVNRGWDLNADGVITDPTGSRVVSRAYDTPGQVPIFLRVRDAAGNVDTETRILTVVPRGTTVPAPAPSPAPAPTPTPAPTPAEPNRSPDAAFSFAPGAPEIGETVVFTSGSGDADGTIASQLWDLDGDGQFDDAGGGTAQTFFAAPGPHTVSLSVTDDRGASSVAFQTVGVRERQTATATSGGPVILGPGGTPALPPLPVVVRIRGQVLPGTVRLRLLAVTAPRGATIVVRCRPARRCPLRRTAVDVGERGRTVRFPRLHRRLRAGTVIEVAVTRPGRIGKWTRFTIRRGSAPSRKDLCLRRPGGRPVRCPVD
jgi:PKD repeat protein